MKPLPLQNLFSAGMKRDVSRNRMPPNSAWSLVDYIIDYGAPVRERSGWSHASNSVSAVRAGASYIDGGIYSIFSPTAGASPQNLAIDEDGFLFKIAEAGTVTQIGASNNIAQNPVFHGGAAASAATAVYTGLVIMPDADGTAVPKKYDGTTLSNLNGSPPTAKFATVYKDYTALGNGSVGGIEYPNRVWWSPPGDPDCGFSGSTTAWDTTDSWNDFSLPVIGMASTKNVMLVFGDGAISRLRGSSPPPSTDMTVDDPWQSLGLLDAFGISVYQDQVFFPANEGMFRTDGVYMDDLTKKGGMLRYWLDLTADATTAWSFATGIIRNQVVVSVMNGSTFVDAFLINLNTYAWTQLTNVKATSFWDGQYGVSDETYFGRRDAAFVGRMNPIFDVGNSALKNDANGTAVASMLETPFYELGRPGIKVVKGLHVGYQLDDYATDNPTLAISYITSPEETSYTSLATLSETPSVYDRQRVPVGGRMYGIGLKFVRANAGDFYGYDLSAEVSQQEESKRLR